MGNAISMLHVQDGGKYNVFWPLNRARTPILGRIDIVPLNDLDGRSRESRRNSCCGYDHLDATLVAEPGSDCCKWPALMLVCRIYLIAFEQLMNPLAVATQTGAEVVFTVSSVWTVCMSATNNALAGGYVSNS